MAEKDRLMLALALIVSGEEFVWHPDGDHYAVRVGERTYAISFAEFDQLTRQGLIAVTGDEGSGQSVAATWKGERRARSWMQKAGVKIKGAKA